MNSSVSPLPVPLWPMLGLSLTLFCATMVAATVVAHQSAQNSTTSTSDAPEIAAIVPAEQEIIVPLTSRFFAQHRAD